MKIYPKPCGFDYLFLVILFLYFNILILRVLVYIQIEIMQKPFKAYSGVLGWIYSLSILSTPLRCCFFCPWEVPANFVTSRPRGVSDHKNNSRNENFRQFAFGAMHHFFFWDGMSPKLWHLELRSVDRTSKRFENNNSLRDKKNNNISFQKEYLKWSKLY